MSGREQNWDGTLWLRSVLPDHTDGKLPCLSAVKHCLRLDNIAVCDIHVSFVAEPEDDLLKYRCGSRWADHVILPGSSQSRRRRHDSFEESFDVAELPDGRSSPYHSHIDVTTVAQAVDEFYRVEGQAQPSVRLRHRLTLT
jgi:hypothetical protein